MPGQSSEEFEILPVDIFHSEFGIGADQIRDKRLDPFDLISDNNFSNVFSIGGKDWITGQGVIVRGILRNDPNLHVDQGIRFFRSY